MKKQTQYKTWAEVKAQAKAYGYELQYEDGWVWFGDYYGRSWWYQFDSYEDDARAVYFELEECED